MVLKIFQNLWTPCLFDYWVKNGFKFSGSLSHNCWLSTNPCLTKIYLPKAPPPPLIYTKTYAELLNKKKKVLPRELAKRRTITGKRTSIQAIYCLLGFGCSFSTLDLENNLNENSIKASWEKENLWVVTGETERRQWFTQNDRKRKEIRWTADWRTQEAILSTA